MGVDGYGVLGYRRSSLTEKQLAELVAELKGTGCYNRYWMHWYGSHFDVFEAILLKYSRHAEFILVLINEEGPVLEVTLYKKGRKKLHEASMLTFEAFTGYTEKEFRKLPEDEREDLDDEYNKYRMCVQASVVEKLKLTEVPLPAPLEEEESF